MNDYRDAESRGIWNWLGRHIFRNIVTFFNKVGIGTDAPSALMHVKASNANEYAGNITNLCDTTGQNYGLSVTGGSNSSDAALRVKSLGGTEFLFIRGDGKIGFGTATPSYDLHLVKASSIDMIFQSTGGYSELCLWTGTGNSAILNYGNANGDSLRFYSQKNGYVMELDGAGNLNVDGLVQCNSFRIDVSPTTETITCDKTITISVNGTNYKIPIKAA